MKKTVFENLNGFKEMAIMENYDLSVRLKKKGIFIKIRKPVITVSKRRHIKAGLFKMRFQRNMTRKLYHCGASPDTVAKWYGDVR